MTNQKATSDYNVPTLCIISAVILFLLHKSLFSQEECFSLDLLTFANMEFVNSPVIYSFRTVPFWLKDV